MLTATLLALGAAVLHAGWNLAAKTAGDRFAALWGQFASSGLVVLVPFLVMGGMPARAWIWAVISGLVHVPYVVYLARAYETGEFSVVYPIARSGGASLAAPDHSTEPSRTSSTPGETMPRSSSRRASRRRSQGRGAVIEV